jgi:hypothetical protein
VSKNKIQKLEKEAALGSPRATRRERKIVSSTPYLSLPLFPDEVNIQTLGSELLSIAAVTFTIW